MLDVNDNAPQMPSNATEFVVSESVSEVKNIKNS